MKEEKIKYESYSVNVSEQDLNPFVERFNREIKVNFLSEKNTSYSAKYERGNINVRTEKNKNNGR